MKLGTFILGGLAGAAVVMLMRGQTGAAGSGGIGQMMRKRMNQLKEAAFEKGINVKFGGLASAMQGTSGSAGGKNAGQTSGDLNQAE